MQRNCCAYCDSPLALGEYVDHMTPISKGGSDAIENIVLACFQCNTEKHAKTATEYLFWRIQRGLPIQGYAYDLLVTEEPP